MTNDEWTDWLRANGFKYEDVERSGRHWLLWIGQAIPDTHRTTCASDFGVEITPNVWNDETRSMYWRADYAGRYSRFLFCRHVVAEDIVRIVDAIIYPHKMADCYTGFGFLTTPKSAARMKAEQESLELRLAKYYATATGEDMEKATKT